MLEVKGGKRCSADFFGRIGDSAEEILLDRCEKALKALNAFCVPKGIGLASKVISILIKASTCGDQRAYPIFKLTKNA